MDNNICKNIDHDEQRIKYVCVDTNCGIQKKIGCADCFLDDHITHTRKTTKQFKDNVQESLDQISQIEFLTVTDSPQKDLEKQIDYELENCLECIKQRFYSIKSDLKNQIDCDVSKLQENCSQYSSNMKNELDPFKIIVSSDFSQSNQCEIQQLVKFYQEAPKILKHYQKTAEMIQEETQKIKAKKQKYLGKMKTIMSILLKELNELMTSKNVQQDDGNDYETPQKQGNMSPNKMINLVETARASRRFPMVKAKKYIFGSVAKRLD